MVGGMDRKPGMSEARGMEDEWKIIVVVSRRCVVVIRGHVNNTAAGCRDVMCVQRAYAYSQQRGVASCIHICAFAELGQGVSQVLIMWSLLLRR